MHPLQRRPSKAVSAQLPSILYRSPDSATVVLDIPRSLEETQVRCGEEHSTRCRIYSSPAAAAPFVTPEPGNGLGADATASPAAQIAALMTAETLRSVLEILSREYKGAYCLPRRIASELPSSPLSYNVDSEKYIPPDATPLHGSIQHMAQSFTERAPKFHLIVMDPPWPNRSVRRATSARYKTATSLAGLGDTLRAIPVRTHLHNDGLVAVWITNKPRIVDWLARFLATEWGLEVIADWTWLKVTASGEPLWPLDSAWRKPWEKLLVAKRVGTAPDPRLLASRTILAVPDVHSRKPNLRGLFSEVLGPEYTGLEVFARGLTAGWWSWGDEVFKFQQPQHWHTK